MMEAIKYKYLFIGLFVMLLALSCAPILKPSKSRIKHLLAREPYRVPPLPNLLHS
jgi:hypothetical protein